MCMRLHIRNRCILSRNDQFKLEPLQSKMLLTTIRAHQDICNNWLHLFISSICPREIVPAYRTFACGLLIALHIYFQDFFQEHITSSCQYFGYINTRKYLLVGKIYSLSEKENLCIFVWAYRCTSHNFGYLDYQGNNQIYIYMRSKFGCRKIYLIRRMRQIIKFIQPRYLPVHFNSIQCLYCNKLTKIQSDI